jgi:hypothetical protein
MMRSRPSPSTVLAALALFFALGGSAFAVQNAIKPQARCATGAVRGIAAVTGEPLKGIANIGDQFSGSKSIFSRTFNCNGGPVEARRLTAAVYEVRFPGNTATTALVSAYGVASGVQPMGGGVYRVTLSAPNQEAPDVPFTVILF